MTPDTVNVQNALAIGSEQSTQFSASLELLKKAVTVKGKAIYDVETLFSRLLVVGQHAALSRCLPV